jgi:hypothetical protein
MGAATVVFPGKMDAETFEALACQEAVSLGYCINAKTVQVACDFKNNIHSLESRDWNPDMIFWTCISILSVGTQVRKLMLYLEGSWSAKKRLEVSWSMTRPISPSVDVNTV